MKTDSASAMTHSEDIALAYEENQAWPVEVTKALSRYFLAALKAPPRRSLFLGSATGVNDALPFARVADPADRILAGDIEPAYLDRLRNQSAKERLGNVEARHLDVTTDLSDLGEFDLVTLLFVIHRLQSWEAVIPPLGRLLAPGGSFFISEFGGPSGIIYLSNENGGRGHDPVSRIIRRYFELLPEPFSPSLKSTWVRPVLECLGRIWRLMGHQDFAWKQILTPREMLRRIEGRAYAPYLRTHPGPNLLKQLGDELSVEADRPVALEETIRVYRFMRPGA